MALECPHSNYQLKLHGKRFKCLLILKKSNLVTRVKYTLDTNLTLVTRFFWRNLEKKENQTDIGVHT